MNFGRHRNWPPHPSSPYLFRTKPPPITTMSQTSETRTDKSASHAKYRSIFDSALQSYEEKTGKDLASDPLLRRLETCNSPDDILILLRKQIPGVYQSHTSDEGLTRWLNPTVKVIHSFSVAIGKAVGPVSLTVRDVTHPKSAC